jgi:hypothetical protein
MIAQLIERARALLRFAPEDFAERERYLPHEWAEWGTSCRWCGKMRDRCAAGERCKVLV